MSAVTAGLPPEVRWGPQEDVSPTSSVLQQSYKREPGEYFFCTTFSSMTRKS